MGHNKGGRGGMELLEREKQKTELKEYGRRDANGKGREKDIACDG